MIRHKTYQPTVPPMHRSAAWIAHNATMAEKRKLLSGQRPVIGCAYSPRIRPQPAVFVYGKRRLSLSVKKVIYDTLCLIGLVAVMGFFLSVGTAVGF